MENVNYEEQDRKKVLDFIEGKKAVEVTDIIENSSAEKLRVYSILFKLEKDGTIKVGKRGPYGAPLEVTLLQSTASRHATALFS